MPATISGNVNASGSRNSSRASDAREFFNRYYVPANITIAIAGDVDPAQVKQLAEKYFSRLPARPLPHPLHTVEPPQAGEKRVAIETPSQPFLVIAYKRPDQRDKDDPHHPGRHTQVLGQARGDAGDHLVLGITVEPSRRQRYTRWWVCARRPRVRAGRRRHWSP